VSYPEAIDLVNELRREWGTHVHANLQGWAFVASYGEVIGALHASAFINANRDPKQTPDPIDLPMPFSSTDAAEEVTSEELADLRARLRARSAFAENRTETP